MGIFPKKINNRKDLPHNSKIKLEPSETIIGLTKAPISLAENLGLAPSTCITIVLTSHAIFKALGASSFNYHFLISLINDAPHMDLLLGKNFPKHFTKTNNF